MVLRKWKIYVILMIALFVTGCSSNNDEHNTVTTKTTNSSHSEEVEEGYVRITISMNNGSEYITEEEIPIEEGDTLHSVIVDNFFVELDDGKVTSLERVKANPEENTEWKLFINGEESNIMPIEYTLISGDKIIFDLQQVK